MSAPRSDAGHVIVIGGGPSGAATAMLLADAGIAVTVLDRDATPLPPSADLAWDDWNRSVAQFRMGHLLMARGSQVISEQFPQVRDHLVGLGAGRYDFLTPMPADLRARDQPQPDDERFATFAARRPTIELAFSRALDDHPGVTVERGVKVESLLGDPTGDGPVIVRGVRTADHGDRFGDTVVDASGRRSPLARWLRELGAPEPAVDSVDDGFVYYGRFFRPRDGVVPDLVEGLTAYGSISLLTLLDDAGWSVTVYTSADDKAMRGLRDVEVWTDVVAAHPAHAPFLRGEPMTDGVKVMSSHVGRRQSLVVDGQPIVAGLVAAGDSWACTNPSLGRGITLGLMHALETADVVASNLGEPEKLTAAWQERTDRELGPWYDATVAIDRGRLAEIAAHVADEPYVPTDPVAQFGAAFQCGAKRDPVVFRLFTELICCLALPEEILARDGAFDAVMATAAEGPLAVDGPTRDELVALVSGAVIRES